MTVEDPFARFRLDGRVAVVTGGSRGLGKEMVKAFAAAGADVVIASRKFENCQQLADEVEATTGRAALAVGCHVGVWEDCDRLADAAYERFGKVDILVNNAGMSPLYPDVEAVTEDLYEKVFAVNLKGPFRLTARIGSQMVRDGGGSIINVSSGAAVNPKSHIIPYSAAKAGLNCMTLGFARTFGPKVRVNCIMAGPFFTDITNVWDLEAFRERAKTELVLQRGAEPHEIVGPALFLASDASSFTTGEVIAVNGGLA